MQIPVVKPKAWLVLILGCAAVGTVAYAQQALSFEQAREMLQVQSPQLAASRKAVESAQLRRQGMQGLDGPSVAVTGMAYRYSVNADLDLDPARQSLAGAISQLPPQLAGGLAQVQLPDTYHLRREKIMHRPAYLRCGQCTWVACRMQCAKA